MNEKEISEYYLEKYSNLTLKEISILDNNKLTTILLEIYNKKSKKITPLNVLNKYIDNYEFYCPSKKDLLKINKFNYLFLSSLPKKYKAIELSPINPFGLNTSISKLNQNNILTSIRNSEVCSDATTALTYEACKMRKESKFIDKQLNKEVNLATIKKVLRMQRFDKSKGYLQHFSQFAIISSNYYNKKFIIDKYVEHINIWSKFFKKIINKGFNIKRIDCGLCHIKIIEHFINNNFIERKTVMQNSFSDFDLFDYFSIDLPKRVKSFNDFTEEQIKLYKLNNIKSYIDFLESIIKKCQKKFTDFDYYIELDRKGGIGYYEGYCFHMYANNDSFIVPLCDAGFPDWNKKILCDNKEISFVSGIGSELVLNLFENGCL